MKLIDIISTPLKVLGVEYLFTPEGVRVFTVLIQKKKEGIVVLEKKEWEVSEFESYIVKQKNSFKILLSGKNLLTSEFKESVKKEGFYTEKRGKLLTIIREESIPSIISTLSKEINFSGLVLGAPFVKEIFNKLKLQEGHTVCYDLMSDQTRPNFELKNDAVAIHGDLLQSDYLGAYLTALSVYLKDEIIAFPKTSGATGFYENLLIKRALGAFGVFVLLIAIGNFFFWDSLRSENQRLSAVVGSAEINEKEAVSLEKELDIKLRYFEESGLKRQQYLSFYTDRLGISVPKSVQLVTLSLNEYDETILRKEKRYQFNLGSIKVNGRSKEIIPFNEWVNELKSYEWIDKIEVQDYKYDSRSKMSEFNLNLRVK